jgi:hypothetical protein
MVAERLRRRPGAPTHAERKVARTLNDGTVDGSRSEQPGEAEVP